MYQGLFTFKGHFTKNGILYCVFAHKEQAQALIDQLQTKTEPHIPTQDIFLAVETFWDKVCSYKKLQLS